MGVLNVTPDSFSDGGHWLDADVAIRHGLDMAAAGADLVDIGGESTRPGAVRIGTDVELARVIPVIEALTAAGIPVSIDTMRAEVARASVAAGAVIVNDVSGGLSEPELLGVVAELGVPYIAMHWRGYSDRMHENAVYADVVADVVAELSARVHSAIAAGIDPRAIVIDPGLGFAKEAEHNWTLLHHFDALRALARRHGALEFAANAIRNACRPAPGLTSEETDAIYAFARRFSDAAEAMKVTAQDLLKLAVIDRIVPEPSGGAHRDPAAAARTLGGVIGEELDALGRRKPADLVKLREQRFLAIGG